MSPPEGFTSADRDLLHSVDLHLTRLNGSVQELKDEVHGAGNELGIKRQVRELMDWKTGVQAQARLVLGLLGFIGMSNIVAWVLLLVQ